MKKKYLIETSAVRPALDSSTTPHREQFLTVVQDGSLYTSLYVRKEFISRWFCDAVRLALEVSMCDNVADALCVIEQDFGPRGAKGALAVVQRGNFRNRG